jgi:hypothetical protein
MAFTATGTAGERLTSDLRGVIEAAVPAFRSSGADRGPAGDLAVARALASVGLGGLVALPFLMLASVALGSPLAGPAAIALGYLPCARELALGRPGRAMMWAAAVLSGLIGWTLAPLLIGGGEPPGPHLGATFFAPVFAAAPALARRIIAAKPDRPTARQMAECLDRMAPSEAVLFVSPGGMLSAGTRAGLAALRLPGKGDDLDVARCFDVMERPALLDALALCEDEEAPIEIVLTHSAGAGHAPLIATISPGPQSLRTMRIRPAERAESIRPPDAEASCPTDGAARAVPRPVSSIDRDVEFAIRTVASAARDNGAILVCDIEPGLRAIGDHRSCRRMLALMLRSALAGSTSIEVTARRVKGVVLLRVAAARDGSGDVWDADTAASIAEIADRLGGSAVGEHCAGRQRMSVRLALAPAPATDATRHESEGVS